MALSVSLATRSANVILKDDEIVLSAGDQVTDCLVGTSVGAYRARWMASLEADERCANGERRHRRTRPHGRRVGRLSLDLQLIDVAANVAIHGSSPTSSQTMMA